MTVVLDYKKYAQNARKAGAEGIVLLENSNNVLPLVDKEIAVFGRTQYDTIYCGTGSGGLVNVPYVVSINEGLKEKYTLSEKVDKTYRSWIKENPFDKGQGWAQTPFSQKEMDLCEDLLIETSENIDTAIFVIGRTAGEDKDFTLDKGSYYLSEKELKIIKDLRKHFKNLVVVVNSGNVIDLSWQEEVQADAIVFAWQGGSETGHSVVDVLSGDVNPSGKLPDTVLRDIKRHPAFKYFGRVEENLYEEDIYVGYRYFETLDQENVLYPFGYGLSYTEFKIEVLDSSVNVNPKADNYDINLQVRVNNIGNQSGKTVVQVYGSKPQGGLGNPIRELIAFKKTSEIPAGKSEDININIDLRDLKSYDDRLNSDTESCYILEAGEYKVSAGFDVRNAKDIENILLEDTIVLEQLTSRLSPQISFKRVKVVKAENGLELDYEDVPNRGYAEVPVLESDIKQTDAELKLTDVISGEVDLDEFIAQFSDEDLLQMSYGNGMGPIGVTAGIAGAFGGVTERLSEAGIPLYACADGPSGIRMDNGSMAFSIPNGTCLAASFNPEINQELFEFVGLECRKNNIDSLLGPGMNIHRYALCGRNFEYFSEDPLLTGVIAASQLIGMKKYNVLGTVKHFALNNQEYERVNSDSVVSERAAREIYLKPFEYIVRSGNAQSIMTSYNYINGLHAASNYDLNTAILRDEWGYDGVVMTDWWAELNDKPYSSSNKENVLPMIRAQNDLFMVTPSADRVNLEKVLEVSGKAEINRSELVRNAKNILNVIIKYSQAIHPLSVEVQNEPESNSDKIQVVDVYQEKEKVDINLADLSTDIGYTIQLLIENHTSGIFELRLDATSTAKDVAQTNIALSINNVPERTINFVGSERKQENIRLDLRQNLLNVVDMHFAESGIKINSAELVLLEEKNR